MKPSAILLAVLMTASPVAAGWASCAQAAVFVGDQQRRHGHDDDDRRGPPPRDDAQQRNPQNDQRRDEDRRDNGINRAIAAGQSRGRVLDAGSQGGSVYWVRVDTGHGRVDLLVDGATGRILGER
jgi:hypothetical protein